MRTLKIFMLAAFLITAAIATTAFNIKLLEKVNNEKKGFALVELYTSEGCSSCPPADALVAKIQKEIKDKPVYILAYHVDYWNQLGWKDVFSNADFSKRQRDYAAYLRIQSVYTPQIIVDGKTEFIGSEESTLRNAIKASLQKVPTSQLTLNVLAANQGQAVIKYNAQGIDKNTAIFITVLQKNAQTKVERGENAGHMLWHVQIVRKLQKVSISGNSGEIKVGLPKGFDTQNWEIIGFLQNTSNGMISAASKAVFSEEITQVDPPANKF